MPGQFNPLTGIYEQEPTVTAQQPNPWETAPNSEYANFGQVHLRPSEGGGEWKGGQQINGGGMATSFGRNDKGLVRFGVDSLETAQSLAKKYGGTITQGYQGAEDTDLGGGSGVTIPGQSERGWGYYYTPPGSTVKEQTKIGQDMGVMSIPKGLENLNDDQFAIAMAALVLGGAAAGGAFGGAAAGAGTAEVGAGAMGTEGAAGLGGEGLVGSEAAGLGGPGVGTGAELTTEQFLAASQTPAVQSSIASASGMTEAQLAEYLASTAPPTYPGEGPAPYAPEGPPPSTPPGSTPPGTPPSSGLPPGAMPLAKTLIGPVVKALTGSPSPTGTTGTSSHSGNPFGSFGSSSNMVAGQAANETPGMQAQAAAPAGQTQQIAQALMLGSQNQPQFGAVGYTPVTQGVQPNAQMMALAKALQGDDDNG